ncbi:MAG: YczE/YyaS/YitT family protein [Planctomycetota bacterium]|jgi:uncharacterized membrane protein YczE
MAQYLSWTFLRHFLRLQLGLFLFACAVATMLEAKIGLDPWSALHEGLSDQLGWSFGRVTQSMGLLLIVFSLITLRVRPGIGTVCNMLFIGPWLDFLRTLDWFPRFAGGLPGTLQFLLGLCIMGLASAVYIGARLGAGPRDGFVMGLSIRLQKSLRAVRIGVELTVLLAAFFLGGTIGLGTVIFALLMGPIMQTALKIFRLSKDPSPSWRTPQAGSPLGSATQ